MSGSTAAAARRRCDDRLARRPGPSLGVFQVTREWWGRVLRPWGGEPGRPRCTWTCRAGRRSG